MAAIGAAFAALILALPALREWRRHLDTGIEDQMLRLIPSAPIRDDLIFLGIDDRSLRVDIDDELIATDPTLAMMAARFPWDRRVYAAAIEKLIEAGARLVVLDLVLGEPSDAVADADLAEVITRHRDRVVLASAFAPLASHHDEFTLIEPWDDFLGDGLEWTRSGYVNFRPDADGRVRNASFTTTLSAENNRAAREGEPVFPSLAAEVIAALGHDHPQGSHGLRFATDRRGRAHAVYEPISLLEIFLPEMWQHRHQSGAAFRDKIVTIGPAAPRFQDQHHTPVGLLNGPQLHLQAITCGLEKAFVSRPLTTRPGLAWWLALAGVACAWLATRITCHPFIVLGIAVAAITLAAYGALAVAGATGILIGITGWALVFGAGVVSGQTHSLVAERLERGRLHREFRRFVSRDVADTLVEQPQIYQLASAGRKRRVAVLFSDVRGFTSRSENEEPGRLVRQLNEYFSAMVSTVFRHSGTLDKFIGDAVMAHWGALEDADDASHTDNAIAAARDMLAALESLNTEWESLGLNPYQIGIGLHIGEAVAGEIGSAERTEFAVIGDAVNLASRIEGLCKTFRVSFLCTGEIAAASGHPDALRRLANVRVVGRHQPVEIWGFATTPGADAAYAGALAQFESGDFTAAADAFALLADSDDPARRLQSWATEYLQSPPADWNGVIEMSGK